MNDFERCVTEFHRKYGFPVGDGVAMPRIWSPAAVRHVRAKVQYMSSFMGTHDDVRAKRLHLILEEVGELIDAMVEFDSVMMLDALVDLLYVVIGTAVTFGLPLTEGFYEIHRSNMTKDLDRDRADYHPVKGDNYKAPNLRRIIDACTRDDQ